MYAKKIRTFVLAALMMCAAAVGGVLFTIKAEAAGIGSTESTSYDSNINSGLTILTFTPQDELPSSMRFPTIEIQFSEPVVDLEKLGEPSSTSSFVTIDPPIEGAFRWYGTSLLAFECSEPIIPQKEYTVTINPNTVSVNGSRIQGRTTYQFHSEQLKITSITPAWNFVKQGNYVNSDDVPVDKATNVRVYFNTKVDFDYVGKLLNVYYTKDTGVQQKLNFVPSYDETNNACLIDITDPIPENKDIVVELPAGSAAAEGYYPTSYSQRKSFHTIKPFSYRYADTSYYSSEYSNPVALYFSHNITPGSEEEVAKHISTIPAMEITKDNIEVRNTRIIVHGLPVTFDSQYTIYVDEGLTDFFGRSLGNKASVFVQVPKASAFAHFKGYGYGILEAQFAPKLVFEYQNMERGSYTLTKLHQHLPSETLEVMNKVLDGSTMPKNTRCFEEVDLAPMLNQTPEGLRGAVKFAAEIKYKRYSSYNDRYYDDSTSNSQTILVTDLAATVRYGYNKALIYVSKLSDGSAVPRATVNLYYISDYNYRSPEYLLDCSPAKLAEYRIASGTTDRTGLCTINFDSPIQYNVLVEVRTANDRLVFNPNNRSMYRYGIDSDSIGYALNSKAKAFVYTDRGLYKPGERITFRGIDRNLQLGDYTPYVGEYKVELTDGSWNPRVYDTITGVETSANGTFWGTFDLPEDIAPGNYSIVYYRKTSRGYSSIQSINVSIQYFERLRFEAKTSIPEITYISGDEINAEVSANYLGGGSLNDCWYSSTWTRSSSYFSGGDKYPGYTFGTTDWDGTNYINREEGRLTTEGKANISVNSGAEKVKGKPYNYRVETTVYDNGSQAITTSASVTVHPSKFYIGMGPLKNTSGFAQKGQRIKFDYALVSPELTAPDATALPSGDKCVLTMKVSHEEYREVQQVSWNGEINTRYEREDVVDVISTQTLNGSGRPVELSFTPSSGGYYRVTLSTEDSLGNEVITEKSFYVVSSDWYWFDRSNPYEIKLTTDKTEYQVGETAQILLQSPLPSGKYMVTVEREGIEASTMLDLTAPTSVIELPILDKYVPVMYVTVSSYSVRSGEPTNTFYTSDLDKPSGYFGATTIYVSTDARTFNIDVTPDKPSYKPGEQATFTIHAADKKGVAVPNAEISLMAVDRGVIDLIAYHVPDPVKYFYNPSLFTDCVQGGDSRYYLLDPVTYEVKNLIGGDADAKLDERSDFNPTAVFLPELITDANGNVTCTFTWPDTITAYRITAVGVTTNKFAVAESEIDVANPVSVRQVLPKELREGDECELGVIISNIEGIAHNVNVTANVYSGITKAGIIQSTAEIQRLPGTAEFKGQLVKAVNVPAQQSSALMFNFRAKSQGWVTIEFIVTSDVVNERIIVPLQIQKPYIYETVTTVGEVYGENADSAAEAVEYIKIPAANEDGVGTLTVTLDPTRLGALSESVSYLFHYPYGCMEQRSSAILPLVIFGDYIDVFGLNSEVLNPAEVVKNEVSSWAQYQRKSGGFPYWKTDNPSYVNDWVTARIGQIIAIGDSKGLDLSSYIDKDSLAKYINRTYTAKYSRMNSSYAYDSFSTNYDVAYGLYVASLLGETIDQNVLSKIEGSAYSDIDTLCYVALTYLNMGEKAKAMRLSSLIRNYTKLTTRGIDVTQKYPDYYWYYYYYSRGSIEIKALMLQLFTELNPNDNINGHLIYELLLDQQSYGGHWQSSALTATVLSAINTYIEKNDFSDTNLTAEVLLNGTAIAGTKFQGLGSRAYTKTFDFKEAPLSNVQRNTSVGLTFKKQGTGKLFYTTTMHYALPADEQKARDEGLGIYTYVEDVKTGLRVEDGQLVEGNVYRMHVYLSSTKDREFVAVRVPVPAGCEIINAAFVTNGGSEYDLFENEGYYNPYGCSAQEIYNIEVQYFFNRFTRGHVYNEFLFRANRPGTYNVPSATAECMYQEEIFGRSNGGVWTVVPR